MRVRIAICDPLPVFRRGVQALLRDAGIDAEAPDDLLAWLRDEQQKMVILTVRTPGDWTLLDELRRAHEDTLVIAILDEASVSSHVRALTTGAIAAIPRDATARTMREAFVAALDGQALVPLRVLRALTSLPHAVQDPATPTEVERAWLRRLAEGTTVNELASHAGYSERMMYRLLRELYTKIGVSSRVEALLRARDAGWLQ
ncbi:hypothetical protein [Actinomadura sp. 9N215]|uniref:hypothetical protein n=1 Tax=Actinomadura sp. 9N215 TaxID=3375150 RepID=UPI0037A1D768